MKLAFSYAIFALIASVANIATQDLFIRLGDNESHIQLSIGAGTCVGLLVKYLLDKHFIFRFRTRNTIHDAATFAFYTLMGVFTTIIFWGCELAFHHVFQNREMRYFGGAIGLAIGYVIKFQLDKKFVFHTEKV